MQPSMETERTSQVILRASAKKADALRFAPGHHELLNCNNGRTWFRELNVTSVRGTVTGARILATFNLKWTLKIVPRWHAMYLQYRTFHLAPVAEPSRAGPC